jgi:hypothetical protein
MDDCVCNEDKEQEKHRVNENDIEKALRLGIHFYSLPTIFKNNELK